MKIILAGCGAIGRQVGKKLAELGDEVVGLKRQQADYGFPVVSLDLSDKAAVEAFTIAEGSDADVIIFTVTPSDYSEAGYRHVYETILDNTIAIAESSLEKGLKGSCTAHKRQPLFLLVSSTGVYGQSAGEWVDEKSETNPTSMSGKAVLSGEKLLQSRLANHLIVRFSGIYGDNRRYLIRKALSEQCEPIQKEPVVWTNRIHESDCVDALVFLVNRYRAAHALERLYLISDDEPVGRYDVLAYLCQLLDKPVPLPKENDLTERCNKRCDNSLITSLGYQLRYPNYKKGYIDIIHKK